MPALRLMTFNVQLLPSVVTSSGGESEDRAERVVHALRALPPAEQPDIIALNEVFNEDGRDVLLDKLKPAYPHVAAKLDNCSLGQDSGLMLFSRLPFINLPASLYPFPGMVKGGNIAFFSYNDSAGPDSLACKGVGVVQVLTGIGVVTLLFTHMQAAYDGVEDMHRKVRASQMSGIEAVLKLIKGSDSAPWPIAILMGDLNIRGDLKAESDEWNTTFAVGASVWTTTYVDGWRSYMRPPGEKLELDPGYTSSDLGSGLLQRLDYQVFKTGERALVPQHMFTRLRGQSDHWALESVVHIRTDHCTPSTARVPGPPTPAGWQFVEIEIELEGSYQWLFVREPGTYSLFARRDVDLVVYAADNLTDPIGAFDDADLRLMANQARLQEAERRGLGPRGKQFAPSGPFFILACSSSRATAPFTGSATIGILRHQGASAAEALYLHPWEAPRNPQLPTGKPLGVDDTCWFRAEIGSAHTGAVHTSRFLLDNGSGKGARFHLLDAGFQELADDGGAGNLELELAVPGPEHVYLTLRREADDQIAFGVAWQSGLTYLRDDKAVRPMALRAIDETGTDWMGGDEIRLKLYADDATWPFFETYWGDADTGEALPLSGYVPEIAFVGSVTVSVDEEGDISASSPGIGIVNALNLDAEVESRAVGISVQSGTYRFECTLDRRPTGR